MSASPLMADILGALDLRELLKTASEDGMNPLVIAQAMIFLRTGHFDPDLTYRELVRRLTTK